VQQLHGQRLNIHPLSELIRRTDLVYFDGPLLSLFENRQGEPYLFLWADVDEDANRWIAFRVGRERLSSYLRKGITLRALLLGSPDGYVFVADMYGPSEYSHVLILRPEHLPSSYLPAQDSYYDFEPRHNDIDLIALAREYRSPLLDLHLLKGRGVQFGTADVITLGTMLRSTGELAESIAVSLFATSDPSAQAKNDDARSYGQFEFVTQKAASFSAILRPLNTQGNLAGFHDRTSEVVEALLQLVSHTPDYAGLKQAAMQHQDAVIRHLEAFAKEVQARDVGLEIRWAMPTSDAPNIARIDTYTSTKIVDNINRLEHEESTGFWVLGAFLAVDTKLRSYRFKSVAGRESTGHFDPKMNYPVTSISFRTEYRVYMNRRTVKVSGHRRPRVDETISEMDSVAEPAR
jgi:hypothetical protein